MDTAERKVHPIRWYKPEVESRADARRFDDKDTAIHYGRAILSGVFAAIVMVTFVDAFTMLGVTPFSYEEYLGSLLRFSVYGTHNWTYGFFINWFIGGLFGLAYALVFENVFKRSSVGIGALVGLLHAGAAAILFFPFFNAIHALLGMDLYTRSFGILGAGLSRWTPFLIVASHVLFGATMGVFYGPVRTARVHARAFEPGDTGLPGEKGVITKEDDPIDRVVV